MKTTTKSRFWLSAATVALSLWICPTGGTAPGTKGQKMMSLDEKIFGHMPDGAPVKLYTLRNQNGVVVKITEYGGIVTEIHTPDRNGSDSDVVLGFDNLDRYVKGHPFFGAIAGRVANRVAKGKFTLDGKEYKLFINNGPNALHGGKTGFDKVVWLATKNRPRTAPRCNSPTRVPMAKKVIPAISR